MRLALGKGIFEGCEIEIDFSTFPDDVLFLSHTIQQQQQQQQGRGGQASTPGKFGLLLGVIVASHFGQHWSTFGVTKCHLHFVQLKPSPEFFCFKNVT